MPWSTRLQCTVQQFCALLLIMGPFWYVAVQWMEAAGPVPTWGSLVEIAAFALVFLGLAMLVDNIFGWLNAAFEHSNP